MSEALRTVQRPRPPQANLPATIEALMQQRRAGGAKTLNDYVEELHLKLWTKDEYRQLLDAVYPQEAVTGALIFDDGKAGEMILQAAIDDGNYPLVVNRKLAVIVKALKVVMNRYHIGRRERANMIGGSFAPNTASDNDD